MILLIVSQDEECIAEGRPIKALDYSTKSRIWETCGTKIQGDRDTMVVGDIKT